MTPLAVPAVDTYEVFTWASMLFTLVGTWGLLVVYGLALRVFVWNPLEQAWQSRAAGNWWAAFEPRGDGTYGPLCSARWFSAMRSPAEPDRTRVGLATRWGFWGLAALVFVVALGNVVVSLVAGFPALFS